MSRYAEMTTAALIDLLFREEDRVTPEHARELVSRSEEAAAPLREILANEDYWYEGAGGNYWIVVHAINILGAIRDERALPILIEMVPHAYFSNHDAAVEVLPAALAEYGAKAVEAYTKFIEEYRGAYHDNPDFGHSRWIFSSALTRIALRDDLVRPRVTDFICGLFTDLQEDDHILLSFSAGHPIALDKEPGKERGLQAVRAAYERGMISEEINGSFKEFARMARDKYSNLFNDLKSEVFDFYKPDAVRRREKTRKEMKKEKLYWPAGNQATSADYAASDAASEARGLQKTDKVGRNDPCPCGSGKKYKKCCGQ